MDDSRRTLEQLAAGTGQPLVIVDFIRIAAGAGLGDLFAGESGGRPVYRIDPLDALIDVAGYRGPAGLADDYARALAALAIEPPLVVGYCSASTLASLLARRLGTELVLVKPTWPSRATADEDFRGFRAALLAGTGVEPDGTPAGVTSPGGAETLTAMAAVLDHDLDTLATIEDLAPDEVADLREQLVARYVAWLAFLLGTAGTAPDWGRPPTVVVSRDFAGRLPHEPAHLVRLDVAADGLLADSRTRDVLLALADAGAVHG